MAIQIGAKLDSGFDDPLGMLKDCHRRIESFLGILCHVVDRARARTLTEEEKTAVEAALKYFRSGGQRHTADEEASLFPRLRTATIQPPRELEALESDHREAESLHASVERLYLQWLTAGDLGPEDQTRLLSETERLKLLYGEHIHVEETIVFPHAAKVLDPLTIASIGLEFEARRSEAFR
jgi:hemerythrin-like domain-containing protein